MLKIKGLLKYRVILLYSIFMIMMTFSNNILSLKNTNSVGFLRFLFLQVMGHRVRGMFASAGRSRGVGALHSLWQQKDCQRRLRRVSVKHTHTHGFVQRDFVSDILSSHVTLCSKIKVWDLQAALDPRAPASTLCLRTLVVSITDLAFCRMASGCLTTPSKCWRTCASGCP